MAQSPIVLGIILRVETRGWRGPPPRLALDPIRIEARDNPHDQIFYL